MARIEDAYPLSPMQQGMLFHGMYVPQSGVYVQQLVCGLHEDLDIAAFRRAWQRVLERHPALRTSVRWDGGAEPLQEAHRRGYRMRRLGRSLSKPIKCFDRLSLHARMRRVRRGDGRPP